MNSLSNLKLIIILLFAFFIAWIPHIDYSLPVHIDEWNHLAYTQAIMNEGNIHISEPFYGQWQETSAETGYFLFIGILHEITGIDWFSMPVFLPGIIFMLTILAVYCFSRRLGFGLESAFLACMIPTSVGLLGPAFMVPAALGLLFIALSLFTVFHVRNWSACILIFIYLAFLFISHSPTAICLIIVLVPFIIINLKGSPAHSLALTVALFAPLLVSLPFLSPVIQNIAAQLHTVKAFPDYVGFPALLQDFGYIAVALSFVGVVFLVLIKGMKGLALMAGLFLLLVMLVIFNRFGYGVDLLYLRGLLFMLLLLSIIGGAGLSWIKTLSLYRIRAGYIVVALLVIVLLVVSLPVRLKASYYHMIDRSDYRAFSWIRDNIPENKGKALVDPWKATAFTSVTGKNIYHRIFVESSSVDTMVVEFLSGHCTDTSIIVDADITIIYNDAICTNKNLIHIYNNVYISDVDLLAYSNGNLLQNPGFAALRYDDMPFEWWDWSDNTEPSFIYPSRGRNGGPCVSIEMFERGPFDHSPHALWAQNVAVTPGVSYYIGGWIKTVDVAGDGGAMIVPHWKGVDDSWISATEYMNFIQGANDWQYFEGVVTAPEGTEYCTFCCLMANCSGKAWFDDVVFAERP